MNTHMSLLDADELIPRTQAVFRVDQIAKQLQCSVNHIFNLITEGEIVVPQERIASASSRASILVDRESIVDFVRRRSSTTWLERKAAESAKQDRNS
jgi:hypothetical protein